MAEKEIKEEGRKEKQMFIRFNLVVFFSSRYYFGMGERNGVLFLRIKISVGKCLGSMVSVKFTSNTVFILHKICSLIKL